MLTISRLPVVISALFIGTLFSACATPLANRRAQVLEEGETEVVVVPQWQASNALGSFGFTTFPYVEASYRTGLGGNADLQLKIDPSFAPEIALGYQLIGDPSENDVAVTLTGGIKPFLFGVGGGIFNIAMPLQAIVDFPLGEKNAFYVGARVIPAFVGSTFSGGGGFALSPGGFMGISLDTGGFLLQPEIAFSSTVVGSGLIAGSNTNLLSNQSVTIGIGFGGRFGVSKEARRKQNSDQRDDQDTKNRGNRENNSNGSRDKDNNNNNPYNY